MISLVNVTKKYDLDSGNSIVPLRNVNLTINKGEFIIITGRSGSGKTTLLNLTAGLIKPTQGQISIGNTDLGEMNDSELSVLRSQKIGFIFQFPSLFPGLTVLENTTMPSIFAPKYQSTGNLERANKLLESMSLKEKAHLHPRHLSAGEQKRVVIARALVNHPAIILADEPTSDLDAQTEQEVMSILKNIQTDGVTIMLATHNLQLISYASRVFRVENGILGEHIEVI
jgi:putative ABC transport system ATP-binding protein